jgi:hypothetical protein
VLRNVDKLKLGYATLQLMTTAESTSNSASVRNGMLGQSGFYADHRLPRNHCVEPSGTLTRPSGGGLRHSADVVPEKSRRVALVGTDVS